MLRTLSPLRNDPFFRAFDHLLADADARWRHAPAAAAPAVAARVNGYRTDDAYVLVLEVPGMAPDQVEIKAEGGALLVNGHATTSPPEGARALHRERAETIHLSRRFTFADDADLDHTTAELKDGLLTLRVPRLTPTVRRIEVKVG